MSKKHKQRPIILYAEEIDFHPDFPELGERITVIDIEMSTITAIKTIKELQRLIDSNHNIGAVRFRISGRISLP